MRVIFTDQKGISTSREVTLAVPPGAEAANLTIEGVGVLQLQLAEVTSLSEAAQAAVAILSPPPEEP